MAFWSSGQLLSIGIVLVIMLICLYIYFRYTIGWNDSKAKLTGKTAIITGANCGIGFYTALDLAKRGARIILACRSKERAERAKEEIIQLSGNKDVVVRIVDLCLMKSVRAFAKQIVEEESRLDILINNAGIAATGKGRELTDEGLEIMFAANHFGPFLLTNLLLDLMKKSAPSRIVNVSSLANKMGKIDFDNLQAEKSFFDGRRYCDSKLANILFTRELARRLENTGVTANVLHPGTVNTELFRNMNIFVKIIVGTFIKLFCKTPEEGAQTSIYLAVSEEVEGISGKYFSDCDINENGATQISRDKELTEKLWKVSEKLVGLTPKEETAS